MTDGNNQGIQTILNKIDTLAQQGAGDKVTYGALGQYIDTLMEEENFPSLSKSTKVQFRKQLIAAFKEYIAVKSISSLPEQNKSASINDIFLEFKDVYQGLMSPPTPSSFVSPSPVA